MDTEIRIPFSITLREDLVPFLECCATTKEMASVDDFFDTAVETLRMHMEALMEYIHEQEANGRVADDLTRMPKCRITFHPPDH